MSRKALLSLVCIVVFMLSLGFTATIFAQDPTAEPAATEEGDTIPATDPAGDPAVEGIVCDSTTIALLVIAKYFGYDTSTQAVDLTGFDLGEAQAFYDAVQPMARPEGSVSLDDAMNDATMGQTFLTYLETVGSAAEGATVLSPIGAEGEDASCLALRESATQYVLLSILFNQMQSMPQ